MFRYFSLSLLPLQRAEQAVAQLRVLNPNVAVTADSEKVEKKEEEFFTAFNVICITNTTTNTMVFSPLLIH